MEGLIFGILWYIFERLSIFCYFSASSVQSDHGNHHVTPKQEKIPSNIKVL